MKELKHLEDIFENYDTFVIDLWGVMHNGVVLNPKAIEAYIASGSPLDKAGAYGIQDSFGKRYVSSINGSYTNIIELPVAQVLRKLEEIIHHEITS